MIKLLVMDVVRELIEWIRDNGSVQVTHLGCVEVIRCVIATLVLSISL